jgi:hypothetical protein
MRTGSNQFSSSVYNFGTARKLHWRYLPNFIVAERLTLEANRERMAQRMGPAIAKTAGRDLAQSRQKAKQVGNKSKGEQRWWM